MTTKVACNVNFPGVKSGNGKECPAYKTCTRCAEVPICGWLIEKQRCAKDAEQKSSENVIREAVACPKFEVILNESNDRDVNYTITVKILNDRNGFAHFLNTSGIDCKTDSGTRVASFANDTIDCGSLLKTDNKTANANRLTIVYLTVLINNIPLRFNDVQKHYVAYYRKKPCPKTECATALWTDEQLDKPHRYFCKWCTQNADCGATEPQAVCDVRFARTDKPTLEPVRDIRVDGAADARIESFEPRYALLTRVGVVRLTIAVKYHWILVKNSLNVTVTVAGHNCEMTSATGDRESIECTVTVTPKDVMANTHHGPIRVFYGSPSLNFELTSTLPFEFGRPLVTAISPDCGTVSGGTMVTVTGRYLNGTDNLQAFVGDKVWCEIQWKKGDQIGCKTTAEQKPEVKPSAVRLMFDGKLPVVGPRFRYVPEPTVVPGQVFAGIASGGVGVPVSGSFACTEDLSMYVVYNGAEHQTHCRMMDDRKMVCSAPELNSRWAPVAAVELPVGFRAVFAGVKREIATDGSHKYLYHPDPLFSYFQVDGTTVTVHGVFLYTDYQPEDLNFQFESTDHRCDVSAISKKKMECRLPSSVSVDDLPSGLVIKVGDRLSCVVYKVVDNQIKLVKILCGVSIASIAIALALGLLLCLKTVVYNSKKQTEKRYIQELQNITAGI